MRSATLIRVFTWTSILSLAVIYTILWVQMIRSAEQRTGSDFIAFYAAGRIFEQDGAQHVYDLAYQQAAESEVLGAGIEAADVNPFVHPAFIFPLLQLVVDEDYVASFVRWSLLMILITTASSVILARWSFEEAPGMPAALAVIGAITFFPAFVSFLNGQDTALLLLACSLWAYGFSRHRDWLAGLGLGLAAIRPHIALTLALPFLFRRRSVWWGFCAGASGLAAVSGLILGPEGILSFLRILTVSAAGQGYHINESAMISLVGLLTRNAAWLPHEWIRALAWLGFVAGIAWLCALWARTAELDEKHIGLAVLVSLFTAPHLHYHDTTLLLIPIFARMRALTRYQDLQPRHAALLPLIAGLALLFSYNELSKFAGLYFVMLVIGMWLWYPQAAETLMRRLLAVARKPRSLEAE